MAKKVTPEVVAVAEVKTPPTIADKEWTSWVLDQLFPDEKYEQYPTCDGLLRIFEIVMGTIISINTTVVQSASSDNNNRATVATTLTYVRPNVSGERVYTVSDAADCSLENTQHPFNLYPSATASTMALGRCLRKALRLKTLVREEVVRPSDDITKMMVEANQNSSKATDVQKNMIRKLTKGMSIGIDKLIAHMKEAGLIVNDSLDTLNATEGQALMRQLQEYNKDDGANVPQEIIAQ